MREDPFAGAAVTALGLAAARSVESGRPDRLVDDPLARGLFLAAEKDLPMRLDWPLAEESVSATEALHLYGSRYIGVRTRFYDEVLVGAAGEGVRQAVMLGAGLDTRAYRLALPQDFNMFELDRPELLAWKRRTITALNAEPCCRLHDVRLDIREDWSGALHKAGFDPGCRTVVIAEGLLPYLTANEQLELLERLTANTGAGSVLAADRIAGDPHADQRLDRLALRSGIDMQTLIAAGEAEVVDRLRACGWIVSERSVAAVAARYGRDLGDPFAASASEPPAEPPWLETTFITARRDS